MIKEFRDFIQRGNLVDLAVAFVMGLAFSSIVNTLVGKVINPLIGMVFDVSSLDALWMFGRIDEATGLQQGSVGAFIGAVVNFLIVALVLFLIVKAYNRFRAKEEEAPAAPPEDTLLLREIRDSLQRAVMCPRRRRTLRSADPSVPSREPTVHAAILSAPDSPARRGSGDTAYS